MYRQIKSLGVLSDEFWCLKNLVEWKICRIFATANEKQRVLLRNGWDESLQKKVLKNLVVSKISFTFVTAFRFKKAVVLEKDLEFGYRRWLD